MAEGSQSLRIDWFDGTLIEETRQNFSSTSGFDEEEKPEPEHKTKKTEIKPIGFKKLLELSMINPPALTLEIAHKMSFWLLLDSELKDDFIVLIVRILSKVFKQVTPGEKSKVIKTFKSKFFKSNFMKTLKEYMSNLPNVRFAEKRMNSHLWHDAESFFHNVILLCEGIIDIGDNKLDNLREIQGLVEITRVSVSGVKKEHSERFDDGLYDKIDELQWKVTTLIDESTAKHSSVNSKDLHRENKLKHIPLFPSRNDLIGNIECDIQPNIVNGAYCSVEHYLELQFKLLREDCFAPLREGIGKYLANTSRKRHENIRVHPKVRVIRTHISNNKVGHLVDIAWKERADNGIFDFKKYTNNKQLMFGSLLLFTSDNFETVLCATVLDSSSTLLSDGYIAVIFQSPVSKRIFAEKYLMIESEVFFEPYHRVLKVLQNANITDLPMKKYIVDVQPETRPPSYLTRDTMYNLKTEKAEVTFHALDLEEWPRDLFDFDESQMEAYKFALTREFAVIQGPPGTGKTYIGVKIASTLLRNLALEGNPMLIICYTNHALDQFLEGILNVTTNVVRLGSQSKSRTLEPYTLNNVKGKMKSKYSHLYATKRSELMKILNDMTELQSEIEKCENEIVSYKSIKPYIKIGDKHYELRDSKEDPVLIWLFGHLEVSTEESEADIDGNGDKEDWEERLDDLNVTDRNLVTCFSPEWASKEIDSLIRSKNYVGVVTDDEFVRTNMMEQFDSQISKIRDRLREFKKHLKAHRNGELMNCDHRVKSLYDLTTQQRWTIYFAAVENIGNEIQSQMDLLLEEHRACSEEIEDISTLIDSEVVRTAKVVGVTTTVAARRHDLMRKLLSPVVIVEEAAEVLEAHIVASLTDHCQHLILIGDHKQLRPAASHYVLARDYNLEVSLFERMIRNGAHARTLTVQRRFRESVVRLLVPVIYDKLDCHPDINLYRDIRGMTHNLYFHDHDVYEDSEEDSWSYRNTYEAKWCVALAKYLRLMKYESNEITILAMYTGQATLIKELAKNNDLLRGTKITVVDNYQGEENRIVILSLVRSNRDNNIGFLSAQNRICVALSRAKEGFYLFGNMNVLKSANTIWRFINSKLVEQKAIGKKITIHCEIHKDKTIDVYKSEDLEKCVSGSCLTICKKNTN